MKCPCRRGVAHFRVRGSFARMPVPVRPERGTQRAPGNLPIFHIVRVDDLEKVSLALWDTQAPTRLDVMAG